MALPEILKYNFSVPVIGAPLFIISNPDLVIAQCKAGILGSFPALNARPQELLDDWLAKITEELSNYKKKFPKLPISPFSVNQIVHKSNQRLDKDIEMCIKYKVPVVITSLGARPEVNEAIHSYGGVVLHDIINNRFAKKAIEKGADGLIAVAAGAGGHAGVQSPFALIQEIREWFEGPVALSGAISSGRAVLAAQAAGADFGYIGSAFIATKEANATEAYKNAITQYSADDIIYTNLITGVHGNYLKPSLQNAGFDVENLPTSDPSKMDFGPQGMEKKKAWKDIWGCGQGISIIKEVVSTFDLVERIKHDYLEAKKGLTGHAA